MRSWLIDACLAAGLTAMALATGGTALMFAEFGGPVWLLVALLVPLVTVGAPSLAAVLLLAWIWPGPSLAAFLVAAAVLAFWFQFAAVAVVRKYVGRAGLWRDREARSS